MDKKDSLDGMYEKITIENPTSMVWYSRCKSPWKRASEEQIKSVTAYLDTHHENQPIGEFKDVRFKQGTIYTVYCSGNTLVELLYDDPNHVAYINRLT
jgi:hypothetical protein